MFRGKKEPDDITPIDSTDNEEQAAVKSAWNLARYGTSVPEIERIIKLLIDKDEQAKKDEFDNDSLRYLWYLEPGWQEENFDDYPRGASMNKSRLWPASMFSWSPSRRDSLDRNRDSVYDYSRFDGTEDEYFKYLDSIAEHPLNMTVHGEPPINQRARNYQYWKALKYGKKK